MIVVGDISILFLIIMVFVCELIIIWVEGVFGVILIFFSKFINDIC